MKFNFTKKPKAPLRLYLDVENIDFIKKHCKDNDMSVSLFFSELINDIRLKSDMNVD